MVWDFFREFPTPIAVLRCTPGQEGAARRLLLPLGLQERRWRTLRRMARDVVLGVPFSRCAGCGRYCQDALAVFCDGRTDVESADAWLNRYVEWKRGTT